MADKYDAGHGWKDEDERNFEKAMNLTEKEWEVLKTIEKKMMEASSKFTFWMRTHQAYPDTTEKVQFVGRLKGDLLERFKWLHIFCVECGWTTSGKMVEAILKAGIDSVFEHEQKGHVASFLKKSLLSSLPEPVARAVIIEEIREAIKYRKKIDDERFKEEMP